MLSAATCTLAEFISSGISLVDKTQISFDHPQVQPDVKPVLNLYCYRVQVSAWAQSASQRTRMPVRPNPSDQEAQKLICQWFDLTFLLCANDHTALGEQHLLSEFLNRSSAYQFLPEECVSLPLRGQGLLPFSVSTEAVIDPFTLWQVLQAPLRLALHVTLTVPLYRHLGWEPR